MKMDGIRKKHRGYGVVVIEINSLKFAIPLRSNINHSAGYMTISRGRNNRPSKGLDYSKALLIEKSEYISNEVFKIPDIEYASISKKERHIIKGFNKYVSRYILAMKKRDTNILNSKEYRYTTLDNYKENLGII